MTPKSKRKPGMKKKFCESLSWIEGDIQWYDTFGMLRLPNGNIAKIALVTRGTQGDYPGFFVRIIHPKATGNIDSQFFRFDDYLDTSIDGREDDRDDYPLGDNTCYHVSTAVGWEWYIAEPSDTIPFTRAISDYIKMMGDEPNPTDDS